MPVKRVLSFQSHVVSGYVGNKVATFSLQLLGFDVDPILSVQFSNHTGYPSVKGTKLGGDEFTSLIDGLRDNSLLNYSHLLTGYVGTEASLRQLTTLVTELRVENPALCYGAPCINILTSQLVSNRVYLLSCIQKEYHGLLFFNDMSTFVFRRMQTARDSRVLKAG